jgi:hypothetical protein
MYDLTDAISDGVARVGVSLFPTHVAVDSAGVGGCRFILIARSDGGWAAGAWRNPVGGGTPTPVVLEEIDQILSYTPKLLDFKLADGRRVQITPDKGCGCGGSKLRMFNPFGDSVGLAQIPGPTA